MLPPEALSKDYEPSEEDYRNLAPSRASIGSLTSAKEQAPMATAFMQQDKAIADLEMVLEGLERRLDPISTRYDEPNMKEATETDQPTSEVVRSFKQNTHKIIRLSERVRRITNELEV